MHGAPYVNAQIGKSLGRLGRSHGCPAVREAVAHELIDRVKGGNLVFAYYPDQQVAEQLEVPQLRLLRRVRQPNLPASPTCSTSPSSPNRQTVCFSFLYR